MKKQKSLKLNFFMNALLTMSTFIFPLITFPYVSRVLLPEGLGKVSFATSFASYFAMFARLGIPTYGIRACAKIRDDKVKLSRTVHELAMLNLCMAILSYIILVISVISVPELKEDWKLYLVVSTTILFESIGIEWLYKALEEYTYITVRSIVFKFIALVAMFVMVHQPDDYIIYGAISIFAASASNVMNFFNARKYVLFRRLGDYSIKQHIKPVLVFFSMSCAVTVYTHLDTVMLKFMTSDVEVGYYSAAVKIKQILVCIVTSLGTVLLPRASYYIKNKAYTDFGKITAKALNFVMVVSLPMLVYFILFAKEGIIFLSGPLFENAILPMQVIMPTLLFIGLTNILGMQVLVPLGKEKTVLLSEIIGAIVDFVLNLIFIPFLGATGAAIGTLVAEASVLAVQCFGLRGEKSIFNVQTTFKSIQYWKILFGIICGILLSLWAKGLAISSFFVLLISAVCFFGIYIIVMLILKETLMLEIWGQVSNVLKKYV